jgi:hypothetical protein
VPGGDAQTLRANDPDPLRRLRTGRMGDTLEFFLRTRTGNVYCIQSPLRPTANWAPYNQPAETLTPGFPGRQQAPLRIGLERPASLVFFFTRSTGPCWRIGGGRSNTKPFSLMTRFFAVVSGATPRGESAVKIEL